MIVRARTLAALTAVLAAVAGCGAGVHAAAGSASPRSSGRPTEVPTAAPDLEVALEQGDGPQNPFPAYGSVWVPAHEAGDLVRVDLSTGKVLARIPVGGQPGGVTAGVGRVWVVGYGTTPQLVEVDPTSNRVVRRVDLTGDLCCQPAVLGRLVWVGGADDAGPVTVAVDASSGQVVKRIAGVDGPVVVAGRLWVSRDGKPSIVDLQSGAVTPTAAPAGVALAAGAVAGGLSWAMHDGAALGLSTDGSVRRYVRGPGGSKLAYADDAMAVTSGDRVWVSDGTSSVWRIDPGSDVAVRAVHLPSPEATTIAGDGVGGVWVARFDSARLLHYSAPAR